MLLSTKFLVFINVSKFFFEYVRMENLSSEKASNYSKKLLELF